MAIEGICYFYAKVSDLDCTKQFYGKTLGWTLHTNEPSVCGSAVSRPERHRSCEAHRGW